MPRTPREIIDSDVRGRLSPRRGRRRICHLALDGGETWAFDLPNGSVSDSATGEPDCTVYISPDDFADLFDGNLRAAVAFRTGKLRVRGSVRAALEVGIQALGRL